MEGGIEGIKDKKKRREDNLRERIERVIKRRKRKEERDKC